MTDFSTVHADLWDREDLAEVTDTYGAVADMTGRLTDRAALAPWLVGDLFHLLHKASPEFVDQPHPRARINQSIAKQMATNVDALREHTVGDRLMAAIGLTHLGDELDVMLAELHDVQEAADASADAHDDYEAACEAEGVEPGDHSDDGPLGQLAAAADAADEALDSAMSVAGPVIASGVRSAAEAASQATGQAAAALAGWGTDPGDAASLTDRANMVDRLNTDRMNQLAELVGRMRHATNRSGSAWADGPGEIVDIVPGNDLSRMTGGEMVNLAVPQLRPLFVDRMLRGQLSTFHMQVRRREERGAVIHVEDSSSTMKGDRTLWARAVGLHLLDIAQAEGRGYVAIVFSGEGSFTVFDFGDDASTADPIKRVEYAEFTMGGGTDFQGPLLSALTRIEDEHDRTGRSHADVVLTTDGDSKCADEFHDAWDEARERLGFTCYGVLVQAPLTTTLDRLCDQITATDRLTVDDAVNLFDPITKEPQPA